VVMKKAEIARFAWYNDRSVNHLTSQGLDSAMLDASDQVVTALMDKEDARFEESQFYVKALKVLISARRVLRWSYPFGFFRPFQRPWVNKVRIRHARGTPFEN
jgi:Ariadne domain